MIESPVMRYHGAKFRLAEWVISFFPEHECYVEPFGGAAGVLMQKPRSYAEVYNDLDGDIVNVFRVLQNKKMSKQLIKACVLTPFSRDEFVDCFKPSDDPIERARRTLFRAEAGFGTGSTTGHRTGFRNDSKRKYSLASHIWSKYPERIANFGNRLQAVIIENRPAVDIINQTDSVDTLFYLDPPYVLDTRKINNSGRVYRHEMDNDQHVELLELILGVDGYVVLSGYDNSIYSDILKGWEKHSKKARISAGRGTGIREECIWLNLRCAQKQRQKAMF